MANQDSCERWGFIDRDGVAAISFQYGFASPFNEGLAVVVHQGREGLIDKAGRWVLPPQFEGISPITGGLVSIKCNEKRGIIDLTGTYIVPPIYDFIYSFSEGYARFEQDGKYGYMNRQGQIVIEPLYRDAENFHEGYAVVSDPREDGTYWYINKQGERNFGPFLSAKSFSEGYACIAEMDKSRYFIDREGRRVIKLGSKQAQSFHESLASTEHVFRHNDQWMIQFGYIDMAGNWAIRPQFDFGSHFRSGRAVVSMGKHHGMIDKQGNFCLPLVYEGLDDLQDERIGYRLNGLTGYMDHLGNVVIEPCYPIGNSFTEGLAAVAKSGG